MLKPGLSLYLILNKILLIIFNIYIYTFISSVGYVLVPFSLNLGTFLRHLSAITSLIITFDLKYNKQPITNMST